MTDHSFYTDDEFWKHLKLFNSFFNSYQWQDTKAAKDHNDEFGDVVTKSEIYFTRSSCESIERLKLSRHSMEKMLMLFFDGNNKAVLIAEQLIKDEFDRTREATDRAFAALK
ncbi:MULTISPECIES: hypothetical protein [unclassified Janthinobacterium]|uniref:hypothetical protein n=1 Tax=unclassified Janthinobacterium TaxID=2610881 RepID=UPI0016200F02|nr:MULTISPECIES: hypothetical protein [unclassified Janthinobacterium]MBB5609045.1 hypothetical protein [Janthinobacterium sp. S3T4]MBB5614224.1 hypothetical protein [Janthinobacterium sp. S3M3]